MIPTLPPQDVKITNVAVMTPDSGYLQYSGFWINHKNSVPQGPKDVSSFWDKEGHFTRLIKATSEVKTYELGWDGYDAPIPSDDAIKYGIEILNKLKATELSPYSVLPSADGGIGISFRGRDGRRAALEILNDGSSTYSVYGKGRPSRTEVFDVRSPNLTPVFDLISENL